MDGDCDSYSRVTELNSPEVLKAKNYSEISDEKPEFDVENKDSLSRLADSTKFAQSPGSALSKEVKKTESRRVSFPEDDKIISGYGEPRNPWAHAKTTSTEELIQAYTQSCQQWGVKPITKLLVQLQEIKDFSVRTHSLTLKGEKLDSKVVETLEAVFKRVQFVIMDLEATSLDEDAAAALFDMIEYYESAVNVLVGFNKGLGTRGWQAAAHMMRKMSCLRLFDGHGVPLTEYAAPFVGRSLRTSNTLVTLHLESAALSGRPMVIIVAALRMNMTLRELFLADNRLISTDALQLANLLKCNAVLQLLDIRNNQIQDAGLCHLCMGLVGQPHTPNGGGGLQTLVLWNNQISHQSMSKLSVTLKHNTSLCTLNLGQNVLGDDGASKLKDGLLKSRSLLRLGMVGAKLTCEGAIALAEYLAESPRIIRLDLRNNDIRVGGLMALSLAFKINHSLLRLDIDKPTSKETLKELVEKQESLLSSIQEYSNRNKQSAMQRVLSVQQEKKSRSEDESEEANPGLRYMDMTPSSGAVAGASTSQNNSNNKSTSSRLHPVLLRSSEADDSPINSPEFLPTNSVSYHQVSPVMFSSSEMQKRAALAKVDDQTPKDNPTPCNPEEAQQKVPEKSSENSSELDPEHTSDTQSSGDLEESSESVNSKENTETVNSEEELDQLNCGDLQESKTAELPLDEAPQKTIEVRVEAETTLDSQNDTDTDEPGEISSSPEKSCDVSSFISKDSNPRDGAVDPSVRDECSEDVSIENSDTCAAALNREEHPVADMASTNDSALRQPEVESTDCDVTVTHFDLSLFPKD